MHSRSDEIPQEDFGGEIAELAELVRRLGDEIGVQRQAIDDLREELAYELRKLRDEVTQSPPPYRLTSMPGDPFAEDFHERVNTVDASDIEQPPATVEGLLQSLMAEPPVEHLAAEDWVEDQEFPPGTVIAIEPAIFDWFAEYSPPGRTFRAPGINSRPGPGPISRTRCPGLSPIRLRVCSVLLMRS
ncbi:MAG: hypothetical protein HY000_31030 [Planctomycetes bacterium]|nr:hypothetical protein [Planctomycetota bacterium]